MKTKSATVLTLSLPDGMMVTSSTGETFIPNFSRKNIFHVPVIRAAVAISALLLLPFELRAEPAAKPQVTIGVTIPLSGGFSSWGDSIRRGMELYAERPGNRFRFDFQDEVQGEPKKALAAYRKYRIDDTRYVVVGTMAGTKAVLPVAAKDPVLFLSIGLVDDEELAHSDKIVSLATQLSTESAYLARYIEGKGYRKVAILNRLDPFSQEFARTLKRSLGGAVVSQQEVDPQETNFKPVLLRIKSAEPDAFFFNVAQDREAELVRQAKELGLKAALLSNYDFEAESALQHQAVLAGVEYSFPSNTAEGSAEVAAFDAAFKRRFGAAAQPGANSYFIYDGLTLLERALSDCSDDDTGCVLRYFKSIRGFSGLSGSVSFNPDGSNVRPYGIKTIRNGKFEWVQR